MKRTITRNEESTTAERKQTPQEKIFGDLREEVEKIVLKTIENTDDDLSDWDRLLFKIIKNKNRFPKNFKLPMIHIVLDAFKEIPVTQTNDISLSRLRYRVSGRVVLSRGSKWKYGSEAWFMDYAYTRLINISYDKEYEINQSKLEPGESEAALLNLMAKALGIEKAIRF